MLGRWLRDPKVTSWVRLAIDECLPPVVRDRRWFYSVIVRATNSTLDLDFKRKAPFMSEVEYTQAYEAVEEMRSCHATRAQLDFALESAEGPSVLDVGAGSGELSAALAARGLDVTATEIGERYVTELGRRFSARGLAVDVAAASLERLPFADRQFDSIVCVHVLEHVRDLAAAVRELKRVARRRIVLVVPRERFHRYSANYHLQFFAGEEQLSLVMGLRRHHCEVRDGALCYRADLEQA
jgi:2-polyprenyl-3-methyl-5-hydroxy-6-metoxy-1,4-benzoquinol methylase